MLGNPTCDQAIFYILQLLIAAATDSIGVSEYDSLGSKPPDTSMGAGTVSGFEDAMWQSDVSAAEIGSRKSRIWQAEARMPL